MGTMPSSTEFSQLGATFCAALSNPRRVRVLTALAHQPRTDVELVADVELPQAEVAGHLQVLENCGLVLSVRRMNPGAGAPQKTALAEELGAAQVAAIGNGVNDADMLRRAALGIAVLGPEGLATACAQAADGIAPNIEAALDLLLYPRRLVATLRT
jgi:soluble P-type ATPase